jgi:hypothetical protein
MPCLPEEEDQPLQGRLKDGSMTCHQALILRKR